MKKVNFLILVSLIAVITLFILTQKEKKTKVSIDGASFYLSIANTDSTRQRGLANITFMPQDNGMLFVFDNEANHEFWMKNTLIPLQILFIRECEIVDIQEMNTEEDPSSPTRIYKSKSPSDKAVELNSGSVDKNVIGTKISELCE